MIPIDEQAEKQLRVLKIITWAMLVVAPIGYLVVALVIDSKGIGARAGNDILLYVILSMAVVNPFFVPLIVRAETNKYARGMSQAKSPVGLYFLLSIIALAMVEAGYVYGLIAFIVTGKFVNMLYFYPIGIAWSFVYWPRREKYDRLVEKLNQP